MAELFKNIFIIKKKPAKDILQAKQNCQRPTKSLAMNRPRITNDWITRFKSFENDQIIQNELFKTAFIILYKTANFNKQTVRESRLTESLSSNRSRPTELFYEL